MEKFVDALPEGERELRKFFAETETNSALIDLLCPARIEITTDHIAEKLDEMADIAEYWRKNRDKKRMPGAIRAAMLMLAEELTMLNKVNEIPRQECG